MDVITAIKSRRSIRKYKPMDIEEEKMHRILEAARLAPSSRNKQEWKFIVVKNELLKKEIYKASGEQECLLEAPAIIVCVTEDAEKVMICDEKASTVNLTIAMSFIMLEATELGLGTCFIGAFDSEKLKDILKLKDKEKVVVLSPIGYADEEPIATPRKELKEIVEFI